MPDKTTSGILNINKMLRNIRFYLTENCNANCSTCFNRNTRGKSYMRVDKFEQLCAYFRDNKVPVLKIMGGEPTLHPDFQIMTEIAQKYFKKICVFTNGLSEDLQKFNPRKSDSITYNFRFSKKISKENLMLDKLGRRSLEIQVSEKTDVKVLMDEIKRYSSYGKMFVNFTLDCTENIFLHRQEIATKYESLWLQCKEMGILAGKDHIVPLCFLYGTRIPLKSAKSICRLDCTGLIDADYNLRHCNQFSDHLINMFVGDRIIPYNILVNYLKSKHIKLQDTALDKICKDCVFYGKNCNGGCFVAKDNITKEDILNNTDFPLI